MNKILLNLAPQFEEHLVVAQVDCDVQPQIIQYFQVQSLPTCMVLQNGRMADGFVGEKSETEILQIIQQYFPEMWRLQWQKAQERLAAGDVDDAISLYYAAYHESLDAIVFEQLCDVLIQQKKLDEVQLLLDEAISLPDSVAAIYRK